jgi:hypothetical protein
MPDRPLAAPLAGIKVLEFSHTVMGPSAGLIFAELGADVVKIEPAPDGDHTRGLGGFGAGFFAAFNRNKRSLAVDLKRKEGQAVIRLAVGADVVLENYGPGTMERLGCGYEQLAPLASFSARRRPILVPLANKASTPPAANTRTYFLAETGLIERDAAIVRSGTPRSFARMAAAFFR